MQLFSNFSAKRRASRPSEHYAASGNPNLGRYHDSVLCVYNTNEKNPRHEQKKINNNALINNNGEIRHLPVASDPKN